MLLKYKRKSMGSVVQKYCADKRYLGQTQRGIEKVLASMLHVVWMGWASSFPNAGTHPLWHSITGFLPFPNTHPHSRLFLSPVARVASVGHTAMLRAPTFMPSGIWAYMVWWGYQWSNRVRHALMCRAIHTALILLTSAIYVSNHGKAQNGP